MTRTIIATLLLAPAVCAPTALAADLHPIAQEVSGKLPDAKSPFLLIVNFTTTDKAAAGELIEAFKEPVVKTRKEPGNLGYVLSQDAADPTKLMVHEQWKSLDALDSHLKQPYLVELLAALGPVLAEPPALSVHVPAAEPKKD